MIFEPTVATIDIPDVNLSEFVLAQSHSYPDRVALVDSDSGEQLTYGQLDDFSARAATGLARAGIGPGDAVALISHNQPLYAVAVHAILRAGGVVCPVNPIATADEIRKQIVSARATVVIHAGGQEKIAAAITDTPVTRTFDLNESSGAGSFASLFDNPRAQTYAPGSGDELAALPFSSGTTGLSKGVMLSHRNLIANLVQLQTFWPLDESDTVCAALPMFHIYGFTVILNTALLAGARIVTMARFDLDRYLQIVQDHHITLGHFAPPMVLALATAPQIDDYDLSSMTQALSGAAPLDGDLARRVAQRTGIEIRQGYGMTEASPGTHSVPFDMFDDVPADALGPLLPATQARIVNPATGQDSSAGEPGELWIRGPQVMLGYLDLPEATDSTLVDGWLRTGDIVAERDGHLYVVDRLKELIKYKGYQVAPAELEGVLLGHPAILDAAVIGVPDPVAGELPVAYVVRTPDVPEGSDAAAIMAWVAERVSPYKKIRDVVFIDQIPKSASGKILRRVLKTQATPPVVTAGNG